MSVNLASHEDVRWLLNHDRTLALLRKETAALLIPFLYATFHRAHQTTYLSNDLHARLTDWLFDLNDTDPNPDEAHADDRRRYPRTAKQYLDEWLKDEFLYRYYEPGADEATYELTPATERAFRWLTELNQSGSLGTESRLLSLFNLLKEIVQNTSANQTTRLTELETQKRAIEAEIGRVRSGDVAQYDAARIRDRFSFFEDNAGRLLSEFRQIEHNFRALNKQVQHDQIRTHLSKGRFLDDVFGAQDAIMTSHQGRSFTAFWELLMNPARQDEFQDMLHHVLALPDVQQVPQNQQLNRLKTNLINEGDRVKRTNDRLFEQLRRFLNTRTYLTQRRASELIGQIEELALSVQPQPPTDRAFHHIDGKPDYDIVWEKKPFEPPKPVQLDSVMLMEGQADADLDTARLYQQVYVDSNVLADRIRRLLKNRSQVSLPDVLVEYPIEKGLTELLVYFRLATVWERDQKALIDDQTPDHIAYATPDGATQWAHIPRTIYLR